MGRVQLITDSGCDALSGGFNGLDVRIIPFPYALDGIEYVDDPHYPPAVDAFYDAQRAGRRATTSQARVADCADVFRTYADLKTPAIYVTLSSGLSGTYNAAMHARQLVLAERPHAEIYVVDSLCASASQALLVSEVARRLVDGSTAREAASWAVENRTCVQLLLTVDSLEHLVRGGRVSPAAATAGAILDIKPIIGLSPRGTLTPFRRTRGRARALRTMAELIEDGMGGGPPSRVLIGHAQCPDDAARLQGLLTDAMPGCAIDTTRIGSIIGTHTGPGAVVAAFIGRRRPYEQ